MDSRPILPSVGKKFDWKDVVKEKGWRMEIPGDPLNIKRTYLTPSLPMFAKDQSVGKTFVQAVTRPPRRQYPRILFQHLNPPRRATYTIHPSMITEDWKPPPPYKGRKGERVRYAQFTFMY